MTTTYLGKYIRKRHGGIVPFMAKAIYEAVKKAVNACGGDDYQTVWKITADVVNAMNEEFTARTLDCPDEDLWKFVHTVEEIQDLVCTVLIKRGHDQTALAYVKYRLNHAQVREGKAFVKQSIEKISSYVGNVDPNIKNNANMGFGVQGLNNLMSESMIEHFWLSLFPESVKAAHDRGDFYIHDRGHLGSYCNGWSLEDLLLMGIKGVPGKIASAPAKKLSTALMQIANFLYTLQGESAGAQAVSSFDTYLAPFAKGMHYRDIKGFMQMFLFNMNSPTRVGFQTPFTNITLDLICPKNMANKAVIVGGEYQDSCYGDYQHEMDLINRAFCECMMEGDAEGRLIPFPIPTYNITEETDWDSERLLGPLELACKFGIPYFSNFINSDLDPEDSRSMCCRLKLDNKELRKRGGGLFGSNPLTGSIGVVTLNLPLAAYEAKQDRGVFLAQIAHLIDLASEQLEIKRKWLENFFNDGLYPYSRVYLAAVKERTGAYLTNHFSTIGLVGMHEALLNLGIEGGITSTEGHAFAKETLEFMRENIQARQVATGNLYNLEATPAESTCFKLAEKSLKVAPGIITAGETTPYFTNSSHLPVGHTDDLYVAVMHQDELQVQYTGGTVFHAYLGEQIEDPKTAGLLLKKMFTETRLPYASLTPTFSICPDHGYIKGMHFTCPQCSRVTEVWSRVTGFLRPVSDYNNGKQQEFRDRVVYRPVFNPMKLAS